MPGIRIDVDTTSSFTNVKNLTKALGDLGKQGIVTESEIKKLTAEFQKKLAAEEAERKAAALGNTLDRVAKSCGMTAGQLSDLRTKAGLAASSMAELNQSITLVHSSTSQSTANFANTGNSVDVLVGKVGLLAAGYISLQSAMQAVKSIASMESLRASFAGIFGDNGSEQFKYVIDAANKYGKSIEDTAGAYRKFAAAADYVGMSTENIRKIFEGTSQAITKVGGSSQDVSGALLAISQSIGKGQVMSEEFRQQFAERIPGAMKMAANAMGVTAGEFQKLMEAGQVLPNEFWPKMADEMSKFSQGWQASSQTLTSDFERMKNALMELGGTDVIQGITKVLGFFTMGTVEESAKRITSIFDDFSTKYKAIMAESRGELSPFESWYTPIDELKKKLDAIASRRSEYISGLKTDIDSLTKSLAEAQSKQLDFGPSGENVDVMRQKLKWFQDLLLQLTGQTHVVNVTANVDMSQLKQAQSYVDDLIKNTATAKSQAIDTERWKLDNAVNEMEKSKKSLEAKMSNPNADLKEKSALTQQLEEINKGLDKTKVGYAELDKQQKKLTESVIKDNSEVKKFNESRGGVSGSEVTHDTQRRDAERLSIARQTDAWREYQAGLKTLPETYEVVSRAQEAETVTQDKITKAIERESKSRSSGANAAARYAERTSSYLEQAQDQYNQLVAMMGGDTLAAKIAGIEKRYDKAASSIRQAMIGAKGSTAELDATLEKMGQSKALEILMAQADAWRKSMQDAANLLGEIGRLSGDPSAVYGSEMTTAQLWEADQQKRINAIEDETEREKQLGELRQAMALKEVAARSDAYESVKAVSSKYWEAERQLIEAHLDIVKANADDELAYKVYAAQQWDEYNKKQLEQQAQTAGTFADTFAARWSLHFGSYKSEMTKTKESWDQMSDAIINSTDGMIDGIAGGFGDMIRNIGNGTSSIEDLWKNMLSRMLDAFASFVESIIKQQLQDLVGGWFSGSASGLKIPGTSSSQPNASSASSSDYLGALGALTAVPWSSGATAAGTLPPWSAGALASSASGLSLSTILGGVGIAAGLVGVLAGLFGGNEEKKKEPTELYQGKMSSWADGTAMSYSVTVMDDGTIKQKTIQPKDIQDTQKAFKDLTTSVKDAAKVLKIDLVENFDTTFSLLTGIVSDELADTVSWVMQGKLGNSALGDLANAVMFFSDGMQNVVEIFTGLADAAKTVKGSIEALGIDFTKFAAIDDRYIETIADFAINGTDDLSSSLDSVSSSAMSASEYISQYSDELKILAEAQMASLYEDALGGKDQFQSAMETYAKYGITTKEEKESALTYYKSELISLLEDFQKDFSGVLGDFSAAEVDVSNIDTFWSAYNAAMQESMSPNMLAAWAEMASYAQLISSTSDSLDTIDSDTAKWDADIKYREQMAAGLEKEAALTKTLSGYEQELAQARSDGMTYTQQAALVQAEIDELQAEYNKLMDVAVDYTSSFDAALSEFSDTLEKTINALSNVASTASSLSSTWDGISDSLESAIDAIKGDVEIDYTSVIDSRMAELETAYAKGMAGDSESMARVADYATSAWDAVKKGATTPEQYDTAYWTIQNRLATAKATSSGMSEYEKTISTLTQSQVDIAQEISDELKSDSIDTNFITQATILYDYIDKFKNYVDLYKAGRITDEEFASAVSSMSTSMVDWIANFTGEYATISADQVRNLVSESDYIQAAIASGSDLTSDQISGLASLYDSVGQETVTSILENSDYLSALLSGSDNIAGLTEEQAALLSSTVQSLDALYNSSDQIGAATIAAILGNSTYLQYLMSGTIQLSGLSRQQASILSSALSAMEAVGVYTGENLTYSDIATYYLAKISDGVAVDGWSDLISTISSGQIDLANSIADSIASLQSTLASLLSNASSQTTTTSDQSSYFSSIKDSLYKQTQIELYTSQIQEAKDTAAGYQNYAMAAMLSGTSIGTIVGMTWLQKYNEMKDEIASLQTQLDYWNNYEPTALATGGVVTKQTLAYIGEGGEQEAVLPLSYLDSMLSTAGSDDETKKLLAAILKELQLNTATTNLVATRVYDRDKNKISAARS